MLPKTLTILVSIFILFVIIELIREEKLTFKYAFGWIIVALLGLLLSIFDTFLFQLAQVFGFELTSNFVFYVMMGAFVFVSLVMTIFLCQQNSRNDAIAQKLGILEQEVKELKEKKNG